MISTKILELAAYSSTVAQEIPDAIQSAGATFRIRSDSLTGANSSPVSKLVDSVGGVELTRNVGQTRPTIKEDSAGRKALYFADHNEPKLRSKDLDISNWSDSVGKKMTILYTAYYYRLDRQVPFEWYAGRLGAWNDSHRITTYMPWEDGKVYFDFGSSAGRIATSSAVPNATGRIITYIAEFNGTVGKLYLNGQQIQSATGLSTTMPKNMTGELQLGASPKTAQRGVKMDFYEMAVFPKVLLDNEKTGVFKYTLDKYGA